MINKRKFQKFIGLREKHNNNSTVACGNKEEGNIGSEIPFTFGCVNKRPP